MTGMLLVKNSRKILSAVDGYIEFCNYVGEIAVKMEELHEKKFQENNRCEPGVWNYEVAEPIGELFAEHILSGNEYGAFDWKKHFIELNEKFYAQ
jgi:hypothetical protein